MKFPSERRDDRQSRFLPRQCRLSDCESNPFPPPPTPTRTHIHLCTHPALAPFNHDARSIHPTVVLQIVGQTHSRRRQSRDTPTSQCGYTWPQAPTGCGMDPVQQCDVWQVARHQRARHGHQRHVAEAKQKPPRRLEHEKDRVVLFYEFVGRNQGIVRSAAGARVGHPVEPRHVNEGCSQ